MGYAIIRNIKNKRDNLVRDFQKETNTFIDSEKQIKHEEREKEWDLEK